MKPHPLTQSSGLCGFYLRGASRRTSSRASRDRFCANGYRCIHYRDCVLHHPTLQRCHRDSHAAFPDPTGGSAVRLYGIFFSLMILIGHMANLRSFGVPYLSPIDLYPPAISKTYSFVPLGGRWRNGRSSCLFKMHSAWTTSSANRSSRTEA